MNVHQIEKFYSGFYDNWNRDAYWSLINRLKITPRQKISTMSCGQRAQVALGLILAQDPDLLILDEPLHGLDILNKERARAIIEAFAARPGKTVIYVTHYPEELPRCIDKTLILKRND